MSKHYVDLDLIIDRLEDEWGYEGMREELYELPSADVVEVVRCKDCVYSVCIPNHIGEDWYCDIKYNEWGEPWATTPGGFCIGGEREENNG